MITMMITKDDDKGDDKKLKDQSKINSSESSESRTIQEFKIRIKKNSRLKIRIKKNSRLKKKV